MIKHKVSKKQSGRSYADKKKALSESLKRQIKGYKHWAIFTVLRLLYKRVWIKLLRFFEDTLFSRTNSSGTYSHERQLRL